MYEFKKLNANKISDIGLHEFLRSFIKDINLIYSNLEKKYFLEPKVKIKINHKTSYKYSTEVPKLIQSVKLYPTRAKINKVLRMGN